MRIVMFYHSIVSDWNNGNAHFLRGIVTELLSRGHEVNVYEPRDGWSMENLINTAGMQAIKNFHNSFPHLRSHFYHYRKFNLDAILENADLVIVHEWNRTELIRKIGTHRKKNTGYKLLFHDTHHKSISQPKLIESLHLKNYDGVLAFGRVIRNIYLTKKWARRAWVWHEAADVRTFKPYKTNFAGDLVWVGNWGDDERSAELIKFLVKPVKKLNLKANIYGVRYPQKAVNVLRKSKISYRGWMGNYSVPQVFARHRVTLHIPRKPYTKLLPGIPTIRPFEALACGIPLVCSPWDDTENLFTPGEDYLVAKNTRQMAKHLRMILNEPGFARQLADHGRNTIMRSHTCGHRVDQLIDICNEIGLGVPKNDLLEV